jgi:hypothetical protein
MVPLDRPWLSHECGYQMAKRIQKLTFRVMKMLRNVLRIFMIRIVDYKFSRHIMTTLRGVPNRLHNGAISRRQIYQSLSFMPMVAA